MSGPLRRPTIPQCSTCLRSYAFGAYDAAAPVTAVRSQVRGKKRMANNSATVPVKLLKDVPSFGRTGEYLKNALQRNLLTAHPGHILPIARGQMRNNWFPNKIASYITLPELRTLRLSNTIMERDFTFGAAPPPGAEDMAPWQKDIPTDIKGMSTAEIQNASAFAKAPVVEKLSPERSMELVEIFVPKRLDFYRQPIIEEKAPEPEPEPQKKPKYAMGGAAGDLMAARQHRGSTPDQIAQRKRVERQAIYGSVSVQDVLAAMRAALQTNDESARVTLQEGDVEFVDLPAGEEDVGRVKHVGEFSVEVMVRGAEEGVRRTVRVVAQEM